MATSPRRSPYTYVTWLTPVLAGDAQCGFTSWYQSHYVFDKVERGGSDLATWKVEHAQMVDARATALSRDGWTVYLEDQNKFTLKGQSTTLAGKPDLVALRGAEARVIDCKTGQRRGSDLMQVCIYLFALPLAHRALNPIHALTGEVQYRYGSVTVDRLQPEVRARLIELLKRVGSAVPPPRVPSARECGWCVLGTPDCPDRIEEAEQSVLVSEF